MRKLFLLVIVVSLAFSITASAGCGACGAAKSADKASVKSTVIDHKHEGNQTTLTGTLVCTGCDLKKAEGARAACSLYGHRHSLKTADGHYVDFLENDYSADLVKGEKYHNKQITVRGVEFTNANLIDVESFEVDGQTKAWCNHCKSMDGCTGNESK